MVRTMLMVERKTGVVCCSMSPPTHYTSETEKDWIVRCTDWANGRTDRRWWLVQCQNADHGRALVALWEDGALVRNGRILASGGR